MIVDSGLEASRIERIIGKYGGKILETVSLFDVYEGEQVPEGKKSLAYSLVFRSDTKTLSEKEVDKTCNRILRALEKEVGATLR